MRWLERCMKGDELKSVGNEGRGLVMCAVFESLEARKGGEFQAKTFLGPITFIKTSIAAIHLHIGVRR